MAGKIAEKEPKDRIRLSLDITPQTDEILQKIADGSQKSKSEVLRNAILLADLMFEAKKQGKKFGVAEKDNTLTTEIIGL